MSLSVYERIKTIKESDEKSIYLVKSQIDQLFYIERKLKKESFSVYQSLNNIRSPYIVQVYEVFEDHGDLYTIEEYINAETLEQCLLNHELTLEDKKKIINQLCEALTLLHSHHIIHRDIKPENIFYDHYQIKIFDFDIARLYQEGQSSDTKVLGSVGYAAPEQFGFMQTDEKTDIYALGVLTNVLMTSQLPNVSLYEGEYQSVIKKATQMDPEKRYQSVAEFQKDFNKERYSWVIPGFRKGILWHKILSIVGYVYFLYFILLSEVEDVKKGTIEDLGYRILATFFIGIIFVYCTNYRNIAKDFSPFQKSPHRLVRGLGVFLGITIVELIMLFVASLITTIYEYVC